MGNEIGNSYANLATDAAKQRIKNANINTYEDINKLVNSSVSLWGNNTLTENEKQKQYETFSQTMLNEYYDLNKDGTVTVTEFGQKEYESSLKVGQLTAEQFGYEAGDLENTIAQRTGNLFAQNLDFNNNGNIDIQELAFFNKEADSLNHANGMLDGIISNAAEAVMFESVTGLNANNQEYKKVVTKYLMGENLTQAEMEILKNCQATIRQNIGRAAGINING